MQFSFLSKNSFLGSSSSIKRDDFFWKWTNEWGKSIVGSNPLLIVHIARGMLSFSPFPYAHERRDSLSYLHFFGKRFHSYGFLQLPSPQYYSLGIANFTNLTKARGSRLVQVSTD